MSKIAVLFADGVEEIEGLTVVDCARRAGIEVCMVSIKDTPTILGSHKITFDTDAIIDEVDFDDYDGIVLPGGLKGTQNLEASDRVLSLIRKFNDEGKLVSAICAAPSILGKAHLLEGKNATAYPGFEDALIGATYVASPAVVDGNIITGRGMGAAIDFALAIIEYLIDFDTADKIAKGIMFR